MIGEIRVIDGSSFLLGSLTGDIEASTTSPYGLIELDTRYLSKWVLTVNGERLHMLSVNELQYFLVRIVTVPQRETQYVDTNLSVIRQQMLLGSFEEQVTLINHSENSLAVDLRLEVDADFADMSEERRRLSPKERECARRVDEGSLRISHQRDTFHRVTTISSTAPADVDEGGFSFRVRIPPHERWSTRLTVEPQVCAFDGTDISADLRGPALTEFQKRTELRRWLDSAPTVNSTPEALSKTYRRSLVDLAALLYQPRILENVYHLAAGLPWHMTALGRDSILTSIEVLPFLPQLARATIKLFAAGQGTRFEDLQEEDPGRIHQEFRYGEAAAFGESPYSPYYGAADTTLLFVILMDEYERWTGDHELVREHERQARAAIDWIDKCADLMGDGYVWYEPRNRGIGFQNQGWKSSDVAICYRDGRLPGFPRATCELQGYAYDAKRRAARLAREVWHDAPYADRLEREAGELRKRFNRDFWVADGEYYALGLDAEGGQIDALASNMGHLLWSGIVPEDRARKIVEHLLSPRMFTGFGIRTLARGEAQYNPLGYHVGTVWPFDNAFIAWGMRRYGFDAEAGRVAMGILDAAEYFDGRLPEAFAGLEREDTEYPIEYPGACSPQAVSAGAPLLLIRTLLGLEPFGPHLALRPALPTRMSRLEVLGIPGRWGRRDAFARGLLPID
jgi:glycogen debranching enzyme